MNKTYNPQEIEDKIYKFWEKGKWFTPRLRSGQGPQKPFTILLPLPNANDPLHIGHALFTVQDILIRYHRMLGEPTLWLPGADHAGIETQFVFEKELAKKGKSRFDYDRKTLYQMIWEFVEKNRQTNKNQLKRLGFSLDWSRYHYSLEPKILETVFETFRKLHQDGLVYRGERIVNFCPKCGTAFSDLEVEYVEQKDFLYYLDYGSIKIATTRPETIFADAAVAVNPKDKRYLNLVGQQAIIPLINKKIPIISDQAIDIKFGTGALKVTPAHDVLDFEIGQKHHLENKTIISRNGRMINPPDGEAVLPDKYLGLSVKKARQKVIEDLKKKEKLLKTEPLEHRVGICYRCKTTIEPMLIPQWFIKIKPLAKPAIEAVKKAKTKIVPKKRFEKMYFNWMENIHDWNVSRQIVWGPQIPIWYCLDCNPDLLISFIDKNNQKITGAYQELKNKYTLEEIKEGLQSLIASKNPVYSLDSHSCPKCHGSKILQETDTFDTWFLSGQWPLTTLGFPDSQDFKYFYPTSVLDTLWDILFFWVARMMMLGLYRTGKVPFKTIHLHCRVVDKKGQKMSKSKGNVIDPLVMIEKYGADALRMALVFGAAPGSDICLDDDKVRAMRNFTNKIWNAARFVLTNQELKAESLKLKANHKDDKWILNKTKKTVNRVTKLLNSYRFDLALETIYQFFWHEFCDQYIEKSKKRRGETQPILLNVLQTSLKLLHPFMPFTTEEIYQLLSNHGKALIIESWPK